MVISFFLTSFVKCQCAQHIQYTDYNKPLSVEWKIDARAQIPQLARQLTPIEQQHTWSGRQHHSGCRSHYQEQVEMLTGFLRGPHCLQWQQKSLGLEVKCQWHSGGLLDRPAKGFCLWPLRHQWRKQCCFGWQWMRRHQCRCHWRCPEGNCWALDHSALLNVTRLRTTSHRCGRNWKCC